jgi:diguanylate cyclase (GGDEF)-like protein/PAS domain S-box-containing protein
MIAPPKKYLVRQWMLALSAFLITATLGAVWVSRSEQQERAEAKARAADLAADHAQSLQRGMERALSATYALAAMVRQGQGNLPGFESVATEMLPFYPGIAALGLAPGGVIRHVVPLAGNEKSIGFNQLRDIAQNKEALLARDTGKLTLAGPMKLAQGGLGIVGRLPIFLDGAHGQGDFWGFSYVTLRFPEALGAARLPLLAERGYAYELWRTVPDTGARQRIAASEGAAAADPVERSLELPNGTWTLSLEPINGWGNPGRVALKSVFAFLASALIAYLAWLLQAMRLRDNQLEAEVTQRTAEILTTQRHLEATIKAIPDLLFEMGLDGRYYSSHSPKAELLARPVDELLGKKVSEVMPAEAAQVVMSALMEAFEKTWSTGKQFQLPLDIGLRWFELSVARKAIVQGESPRFVVLSRDITENKEAEEKIGLLAHFDALTGLPNRALLSDRCQFALHAAQRNHSAVTLMFLDLDHFKNVNDSLGHRVGDALLVALAGRLQSAVRDQDTVSRLGGDEFILVLPDTDAVGAAHVAEKLLQSALRPFQIEQHELTITPSIGIAIYPADGNDFDTLSRCADAAMYDAKQGGRNHYRFFTAQMQARSERALTLENALRRALERDQLRLHYQPQISVTTGRVIGAEALLRWSHPELGMVSPAEFIPVAESSGIILPIGEWVLRTATRQLRTWIDAGIEPFTMAVNLSSVQFRYADLPTLITSILNEVALPAHLLELELTEGVAMTDPVGAIEVMNDLHQRGVRMSIDDFGTGYSSLSYLKKFQVYKVKIDQSFVQDITDDADDRAIVGAIISMASSLGMQTIAEGVETQGQLDFLQEKGCTEVQGYFFSRPVPPEQFVAFLRSQLLL